MKENVYSEIKVESYLSSSTSGLHGSVHIRPLPNQYPFEPHMHVECSKELSNEYPVGTRFMVTAKITSRQGGTPFIYSHYSWPYKVLKD